MKLVYSKYSIYFFTYKLRVVYLSEKINMTDTLLTKKRDKFGNIKLGHKDDLKKKSCDDDPRDEDYEPDDDEIKYNKKQDDDDDNYDDESEGDDEIKEEEEKVSDTEDEEDVENEEDDDEEKLTRKKRRKTDNTESDSDSGDDIDSDEEEKYVALKHLKELNQFLIENNQRIETAHNKEQKLIKDKEKYLKNKCSEYKIDQKIWFSTYELMQRSWKGKSFMYNRIFNADSIAHDLKIGLTDDNPLKTTNMKQLAKDLMEYHKKNRKIEECNDSEHLLFASSIDRIKQTEYYVGHDSVVKITKYH